LTTASGTRSPGASTLARARTNPLPSSLLIAKWSMSADWCAMPSPARSQPRASSTSDATASTTTPSSRVTSNSSTCTTTRWLLSRRRTIFAVTIHPTRPSATMTTKTWPHVLHQSTLRLSHKISPLLTLPTILALARSTSHPLTTTTATMATTTIAATTTTTMTTTTKLTITATKMRTLTLEAPIALLLTSPMRTPTTTRFRLLLQDLAEVALVVLPVHRVLLA